jgi:hypothetical protein
VPENKIEAKKGGSNRRMGKLHIEKNSKSAIIIKQY